MKRKELLPLVLFPGIIFLLFLTACAGLQNWGHYTPDNDVTKSYETAQLDPAYQYFYSGPESGPTAILGLKKEYTLVTDIWQKIEPNQAALAKLLDGMRTRSFGVGRFLKGYVIYDHNNDAIGTWYSIFEGSPTIHLLGQNKVEISSPPTELYDNLEGDEGGESPGGERGHH